MAHTQTRERPVPAPWAWAWALSSASSAPSDAAPVRSAGRAWVRGPGAGALQCLRCRGARLPDGLTPGRLSGHAAP